MIEVITGQKPTSETPKLRLAIKIDDELVFNAEGFPATKDGIQNALKKALKNGVSITTDVPDENFINGKRISLGRFKTKDCDGLPEDLLVNLKQNFFKKFAIPA